MGWVHCYQKVLCTFMALRNSFTGMKSAAVKEKIILFPCWTQKGFASVRVATLLCFTGRTPLFFAILCKGVRIAKYLLDHGANPNIFNSNGLSPLHQATVSGLFLWIHMPLFCICALQCFFMAFQFLSCTMVWLSVVLCYDLFFFISYGNKYKPLATGRIAFDCPLNKSSLFRRKISSQEIPILCCNKFMSSFSFRMRI